VVRVAVLVNNITSTSIPVETAITTHKGTNADVILVSYYDDPRDEFDPDIQKEAIPIVCLGANSRLDYAAYRTLRRLCIDRDIDVLHTHHNSTGSMGRLATAGTDIQILNTEHNDHRFFTHLQKSVNAVTYPLTSAMVYNSRSTGQSLNWYERILSKWCRKEIIYNGIDVPRITNEKKDLVDLPDGPLITTAGRLVHQKNHKSLLRAFSRIVEEFPDTNLVIVGDGPLYEDLESLSHNLEIQDSVVFTGYLPRREDVYAVLKNSSIGVFSSWYEGFCVAAVEAMAAGLPVVVSDIDVLHEVVGDPGVFADPNEPSEFAEAISNLLEHPQKRKKLGHRAKQRARSKFSIEHTASKYYNIYKEVAETSKR